MTPIHVLRMAWAGAILAAASGFAYLAYAPVPGSHSADTLLTLGVALLGAVLGATVEAKVEKLIASRRTQSEIIAFASTAQPLEELSARGA